MFFFYEAALRLFFHEAALRLFFFMKLLFDESVLCSIDMLFNFEDLK